MGGAEVRVITGPTAAGKSALALALARRFEGSIISADSRQIYRGFDIGTAKPTAVERDAVPHHGIDVADPDERFSAAAWAVGATRWIDEIRACGREPLVVGGTGFYLRALFTPLFVEPPLDPARRKSLQAALHLMATPELRRWCDALDPARASLGRAQLLRAIEVALLAGQRLSDLHRREARPPRWHARYLVVDPGGDLPRRIEERVDAMVAQGWLGEVRTLVDRVAASAPAWNAAGYRAMRELALGHCTPAAARQRVVIETRQYAKRQRTWFRHQLAGAEVTRLDPARPDAMTLADRWWRGDRA